MSNHFPTVPAMELQTLTYVAQIRQYGTPWSFAAFNGISGVYDQNSTADNPVLFNAGSENEVLFQVGFVFETPGSAGGFDQDTQESTIVSALNEIAQVIATVNNVTLATAKGLIIVQRQWTWQDSGNTYLTTYTDNMTYP